MCIHTYKKKKKTLKSQVFDVQFITPFEVSEIIKKLDTCKATGIDEIQISADVLKHC